MAAPAPNPPAPEPPAASGALCEPLSGLPAGCDCVVNTIVGDDAALAIRLKTMGLHEGRSLRVLHGGKRLIVACGATRIGLSAAIAGRVLVRRTSSP